MSLAQIAKEANQTNPDVWRPNLGNNITLWVRAILYKISGLVVMLHCSLQGASVAQW